MFKRTALILAVSTLALTGPSLAKDHGDHAKAKGVEVGGAMMSPKKTIPQNAMKADNLKTLVAAVKAAGLVETLSGEGPFTVFAPTDDAFAKLPAGTVEELTKPENKEKLTKILTYHVVAGKMTSHDLVAAAQAGGGKATLTTVEGETLTVGGKDGKWAVWDANGGTSYIETPDVIQKNGVVHVVDTVLMPKTEEAAAPAPEPHM